MALVRKTTLLLFAVAVAALLALSLHSSNNMSAFAAPSTSKRTKKAAKAAAAAAAAAAAPSAADTVLSAANVRKLVADEPNARLTELGDLSDSDATRTRLYLSPSHQEAAELIKKWMAGAGLDVSTDAVGNIRGRIDGNGTAAVSTSAAADGGKKKKSNSSSNKKNAVAKRWLTGSHFDVVPEGGAFDGALGVVLSIAAVEASVAEAAVAKGIITNRQLSKALASGKRVADLVPKKEIDSLLAKGVEVIAFADQEGARFGVPMASSKAVIGTYESEGLLKRADARGITVERAIKEEGKFRGKVLSFQESVISADEVEGYIEAHIEQYDRLERIGSPVGIVTAVAGTTVMHVSVRNNGNGGKSGSGDDDASKKAVFLSHAASVPMAARADPVPAVAEAVLALEKRCKGDAKKGAPHGVLCGVHFLTVDPNTPLNIPSNANFTVTVASTSDAARRLVVDGIVKDLDDICKGRKLACTAAYMMDSNGAKSHAAVRARLEADASDALKALPSVLQGDKDLPPLPAPGATDELIVNVPDLWSGTDSDVLTLAKKFPVALLHVRHRGGLTHSLAEHAEPSDVASAGVVLHKFLSRQLLGRKEVDWEGEGAEGGEGKEQEGKKKTATKKNKNIKVVDEDDEHEL